MSNSAVAMPDTKPNREIIHWRARSSIALGAMFITKLLRQRHLPGGIEELELPAIGQLADPGKDRP